MDNNPQPQTTAPAAAPVADIDKQPTTPENAEPQTQEPDLSAFGMEMGNILEEAGQPAPQQPAQQPQEGQPQPEAQPAPETPPAEPTAAEKEAQRISGNQKALSEAATVDFSDRIKELRDKLPARSVSEILEEDENRVLEDGEKISKEEQIKKETAIQDIIAVERGDKVDAEKIKEFGEFDKNSDDYNKDLTKAMETFYKDHHRTPETMNVGNEEYVTQANSKYGFAAFVQQIFKMGQEAGSVAAHEEIKATASKAQAQAPANSGSHPSQAPMTAPSRAAEQVIDGMLAGAGINRDDIKY